MEPGLSPAHRLQLMRLLKLMELLELLQPLELLQLLQPPNCGMVPPGRP